MSRKPKPAGPSAIQLSPDGAGFAPALVPARRLLEAGRRYQAVASPAGFLYRHAPRALSLFTELQFAAVRLADALEALGVPLSSREPRFSVVKIAGPAPAVDAVRTLKVAAELLESPWPPDGDGENPKLPDLASLLDEVGWAVGRLTGPDDPPAYDGFTWYELEKGRWLAYDGRDVRVGSEEFRLLEFLRKSLPPRADEAMAEVGYHERHPYDQLQFRVNKKLAKVQWPYRFRTVTGRVRPVAEADLTPREKKRKKKRN